MKLNNKTEQQEGVSLLANWFAQLMLHGRRSAEDYQSLEQVYHDKYEAKAMLDNAIQQIRQQERAVGRAEGLEEGIFKGRIEGLEEGIFKGRVEGKAEGKAEALIVLLENRFSPLMTEEKERLFQLSDEKLIALLVKFYSIENISAFWREIETH
ncbi:hypothetical protein BegalDRAFT_2306 [Beggiatoa alba B18LD]|uniref:DUF4351 domain-containing protein n=1 Tax=Beggiatoa alba B18LD TaxID=395493 RepID=I3CHR7_9GAMM|nr:hypothetical protein [Beggiatoa alba]EIJ43160.1 hypothetical protein BegalDRAFT_2306 [Beggiatoa alba B18LD]